MVERSAVVLSFLALHKRRRSETERLPVQSQPLEKTNTPKGWNGNLARGI